MRTKHSSKFYSTSQKAFTLAEVLITLAIIGIIAALTIPNLYAKYEKEQTLTKFKKIYSVLNNAYKMSAIENGPAVDWTFPNADALADYLVPYLKVAKNCGTTQGQCFPATIYALDKKTVSHMNSFRGAEVMLEDGVSLRFALDSGYPVIYADLNSLKKPNSLGKDVFLFTIDNRNGHKNEFGGYNFHNCKTRTCFAQTDVNACNLNPMRYSGMDCASLIIFDGMQMKSDYPW